MVSGIFQPLCSAGLSDDGNQVAVDQPDELGWDLHAMQSAPIPLQTAQPVDVLGQDAAGRVHVFGRQQIAGGLSGAPMKTPLADSVCEIARVPECPRPIIVTVGLQTYDSITGRHAIDRKGQPRDRPPLTRSRRCRFPRTG